MHLRGFVIVVIFLAGLSFFAGFLLFGRNLSFPNTLPFFKIGNLSGSTDTAVSNTTYEKTLNVAITETNGWHDEVVSALAHSFGSQPCIQLDIYQSNSRFGMSEITSAFQLSHSLPTTRSPDEFNDNSTTPDIVVLTTGELDSVHLQRRLQQLLAGSHTYLYCVVHHGDRWNSAEVRKVIAPWMDKRMVEFVTLSPHTAAFLKANGLEGWSRTSPIIKSIAPLFPVPAPSPNRKGVIDKNHELAFAIQGNYEPSRRDFDTIFSHLQSFVDSSNSREDEDKGSNVTLHLLGSGNRPSVPSSLSDHVFFDENLSYSEYYAVLSNTFAILPAFADKDYLDRKASSTIPASLLSGTPLVATREILSAYSYLPEDAIYLQEHGETALAAVGRILQLTATERRDKTTKVRNACASIIETNIKLVAEWIKEAKAKVG